MSAAPQSAAQPAAFSRAGALALVMVGFAVFLAMIYLIAAGEQFGGDSRNGRAHAAGTGLNGYAGLVKLVEADGYDVTRSRSPSGLETYDLLVLTPPSYLADEEDFVEILKNRENIGPTLVILPKWDVSLPPNNLPNDVRKKFKSGWVVLDGAFPVEWSANLPAPYTIKHNKAVLPKGRTQRWAGLDETGTLPTRTVLFAEDDAAHQTLISDASGRHLAVRVNDRFDEDTDDYIQPTVFVTEADLMNNYGLANGDRAAAALALVNSLTYDNDITGVTFDMTLNGFGASENLLTLAFRPPFLAATLCLLMTLLIIGWRAFQRFGPAAVSGGPDIAFGKQRLIANGASLILRARRLPLLSRPFAALSARRMAERLGLVRPDLAAIDAVIARRLPDEEPFSRRVARMEAATKPADILSAAKALDDLATQLSQGK